MSNRKDVNHSGNYEPANEQNVKMADVSVNPECKDPKELFGQGVRAYVLQDFEVAVSALSRASELLVEEHTDPLHESLGEVYLFYGKSLLGLSREQNEALGDAVPKNSAEDTEDDEDDQDEGIETEESEENKTEENSASSSVNGDASKSEAGSSEEKPKSCKNEAGPSKSESSGEPSSSKENDEEMVNEQQNGEDDASDLQLAWEVLELAKKIFQKQDNKKSLAETLIVLGEVSLESENFESAISDIKQGFEIQKELFGKDSRAVAETLYKLGIAYSTNSQIDDAIGSFKNSLEYLRNRIKTLEEIKVMSQEHKDEVEEIKNLIPDIEDKIADMHVYKEEAIKKVAEAFHEPPKQTQDGAAGSSKQVTDITHLVKRKRKLEEEEDKPDGETPTKKVAT